MNFHKTRFIKENRRKLIKISRNFKTSNKHPITKILWLYLAVVLVLLLYFLQKFSLRNLGFVTILIYKGKTSQKIFCSLQLFNGSAETFDNLQF